MNRQPSKRKRGVVLTSQGWQRLQAAKQQLEIHVNFGNSFTLEELSQRANLSPNTLTRIQHRKVAVDRQSLAHYFHAFNLTLCPDDYTKLEATHLDRPQKVALKSQIPLNSPFYIERPVVERMCYQTIMQPGALIRIQSPKLMGKTSLMARLLQQARRQGLQTITLSLQLADIEVFCAVKRFLQWFCAVVTQSLGLPNRLVEYWDELLGSSYNCTHYFENYLLTEIDTPIALALDEVDVVFNYPEIATDFFGLLRAWHEKANYGDSRSEIWQNLRLVIVHSTEVYISLYTKQFPFNIGLTVELPELTRFQVRDLANRYELDWGMKEVEYLMGLVGGNPYLVQVALHHISNQTLTLDQLWASAIREDSIYADYLRHHLWNLKQYPELVNALTRVVRSPEPVELKPVLAFQLNCLGLVKLIKQQVVPRWELVRQYFSESLRQIESIALEESCLSTIVAIDAVNFTQQLTANRERTLHLLYQDLQLITRLCEEFEGQILKSLGDGLVLYFSKAINAVNCAQEIQVELRQAAKRICPPVLTHRIGIHFGQAIFRYTEVAGSGLNMAMRVQAEAPPGGICISQTVYEAVKHQLPLQPINLGQRQLEEIEAPILLYQLTL